MRIMTYIKMYFKNFSIHYFFKSFIVQEVQEEGKYAIESPGSPITDLPPEEYNLSEMHLMQRISFPYKSM